MTPAERLVNDLPLSPVDPPPAADPDGLPHVTHGGVLRLGGHRLRVCQLSDGRRIIDGEDFERIFREAMS